MDDFSITLDTLERSISERIQGRSDPQQARRWVVVALTAYIDGKPATGCHELLDAGIFVRKRLVPVINNYSESHRLLEVLCSRQSSLLPSSVKSSKDVAELVIAGYSLAAMRDIHDD